MSLEGRTIALVEDDPIMGESLVDRLTLDGAKVHWFSTCRAAAAGIAEQAPDIVLCDIRLPDGTGEDIYAASSAVPDAPPFIFMTGFGDIDQAVRLMKNGAGDYVTKPFETSAFLARVEQLIRARTPPDEPVLGVSARMAETERLLRRFARLSAPVLLQGETGAGKEVCARFLHDLSRGGHPFMAVNCAAIPKDLLESELFGHERGAFTGAQARHRGYAERAGKGTLFLDEISELEPKLQAKLLRLIEDRVFHRVGGEEPVRIQARLVCATNADLSARVRTGAFREDLLYRINVLALQVPPLRDRPDDIEWLAERFFQEFSREADTELLGLSANAVTALCGHGWPGNVRELRNRMERAAGMALGPWVLPGDLFPENAHVPERPAATLEEGRNAAEKRLIQQAIQEAGGVLGAAASRLGVSRTTLWEKMRKYGIDG
ncbi:sigma-54-dependent Fis family transcriptional regulator [Alsobacter soli]|uniref:Sigma-54-dependent Fis family transcriptional regulator n=1 Tax=Alsobacter soli TaxID=2109933 RepID=A0A2T1HVH4_9HYPH|nr:sigma-54 dependent transcriptional regulator [Alsobacter soli]PSC05644.1 sigma-54-dependent Fis family transcriptional regulator [Alsobacter soli]